MEKNLELVVPNLHFKHTGVTSTVSRLLPIIEKALNTVTLGKRIHAESATLPVWKTLFFPRSKPVIWHARRNSEMLLGIILKFVFFCNFKLIFTTSKQKPYSLISQLLISRMDKVIATSKASQNFLVNESEVIRHGVDTDIYFPCKNKQALRQSLKLSSKLLIGCFGRVRPLKGTDIFVDTAIQLLKEHKNYVFIIVGRTNREFKKFKEQQLEKVLKADLTQNILFFEEVQNSEIFKWYQSLDLLIAPGRYEGFGLTPLEAMASGVPAIAFRNVGAYSEQIVNGKTGYIIDQIDSKLLVKKLKELLKDQTSLETLGHQARKHVVKNFNIKSEADSLIDLYRNVLNR